MLCVASCSLSLLALKTQSPVSPVYLVKYSPEDCERLPTHA